jgi:hypothetical protein
VPDADSDFYRKMHATSCRNVRVPREACYVSFGSAIVAHSDEIGFTTRGECVIADYDKEGHIIGLELLSPDKSCQH